MDLLQLTCLVVLVVRVARRIVNLIHKNLLTIDESSNYSTKENKRKRNYRLSHAMSLHEILCSKKNPHWISRRYVYVINITMFSSSILQQAPLDLSIVPSNKRVHLTQYYRMSQKSWYFIEKFCFLALLSIQKFSKLDI